MATGPAGEEHCAITCRTGARWACRLRATAPPERPHLWPARTEKAIHRFRNSPRGCGCCGRASWPSKVEMGQTGECGAGREARGLARNPGAGAGSPCAPGAARPRPPPPAHASRAVCAARLGRSSRSRRRHTCHKAGRHCLHLVSTARPPPNPPRAHVHLTFRSRQGLHAMEALPLEGIAAKADAVDAGVCSSERGDVLRDEVEQRL